MKKSDALGGHPIAYCVIPDSCEAIVTYRDKRSNANLKVEIESKFGRVSNIQDHTYATPTIMRTLEELRDEGVKHVTLHCRHHIDIDEVIG